MQRTITLFIVTALLPASLALAVDNSWVEESNENAQLVLNRMARYSPELAAGLGVEGYDAEILDLKENGYQRRLEDFNKEIDALNQRLQTAENTKVIQDLEILIKNAKDNVHTAALNRQYMLPYYNLPQSLFFGFQSLLDSRVDSARYPAALERLKKYNGNAGTTPITTLAMARSSERFSVPGLVGPYRDQLERDLGNFKRFLPGIKDLFETAGLEDWQEEFKLFSEQMTDYKAWLEQEMMPRTRSSHRLPEEIYANNLKNFGVDVDPQVLMQQAKFGFMEIRFEMQAIASRIAEQRGFESDDYRDVIKKLKEDQIENDVLLPLYRERLAAIEDIIRREEIISLPERDAVIRLATEAESAGIPAPHLNPPQLIGNTGQPAEFVLVQSLPGDDIDSKMDDFSYDAFTWTATIHEARPGHELQFASMIEAGVSIARAVFAFNSANVEGWALYAEAIMKEHLPLEGQLLSLQSRAWRAARAMIDPMLNLGLIEPAAAKAYIMDELVLSNAMAQSEINRYTFQAPGQATSYYYGYMRMLALRTDAELALRDKFKQKAFHDFVLAQGLLPPKLLAKAVKEEFIPSQM